MESNNTQVVAAFATDIYTYKDYINGYGAYYLSSCVVDDNFNIYNLRDERELHEFLVSFIKSYVTSDIVPVIMCEDLSRDVYFLANFLNSQKTRVVAKNSVDILKIDILDKNNKKILVLWDTKEFFLKKIQESEKIDKRLFFLWENYKNFADLHDFIKLSDYGNKILTATSVVRVYEQRKIYPLKGKKYKAGYYRYWLNKREKVLSDDELYSTFLCNKGGFSFCNSLKTGVAFDFLQDSKKIVSIDATSHYPAQIVSHLYPEQFEITDVEVLEDDADIIREVTTADILANWHKPFFVAFHACFIFEKLHLKENTFFAKNKIGTLPMSIFQERAIEVDDNFNANFVHLIRKKGYFNKIFGYFEKLFNKLIYADAVCVWLNELEYWILTQVYEFENQMIIKGYETGKFCKPADSSVLSVMHFYERKQEVKTRLNSECKDEYEYVKRDLNSIYGREVAIELYSSFELDEDAGLAQVSAPENVEDLPANCKTWQQFGQRVSGWGRIAQIVLIDILKDFDVEILAGDTDSLKLIIEEQNLQFLDVYLQQYSKAITLAKDIVCKRVYSYYDSEYLSDLAEIGNYKIDWISNKFYAARNKCYAYECAGELHAVTTGIAGDETLDILARELQKKGLNFKQICEKIFAPDFILTRQFGGKEIVIYPNWQERLQTDLLIEQTGEIISVNALAAPYRNTANINLWSSSKKDITQEIAQIEQNRSAHETI